MEERKKISVAELAALLGASEAWAGAILNGFKISIDTEGKFDLKEAQSALEKASKIVSSTSMLDESKFIASEMGPTEETCRLFFISQLEQEGLRLEGRKLRRGSLLRFVRPDDTDFRILSYVALRPKANNQISFTVNHMDDPGLDWIAFIAKPFGRVFLRRRKEILERMRIKPGEKPKSANVTFSPNTTSDLLEHRVKELLKNKLVEASSQSDV